MSRRPRLAVVPDQPPRAILYLRQSVHRDESVSLELQETAGRDHCARHGYVVVDVIKDPGRSGRTFHRRRVIEALERIERGEAERIVLWKWSRLSRSRRDWAIAVDRAESAGGSIESATEAVDVATASGRLQRGMLAEFAAFESDRIGEVWQEVHARRVGRGRPANGKPRWGYVYDRENGFTPDPVTGPVLASLYRRYAAGTAAHRLAEWLRANGYRTSPGYSAAGPTEFTFGQLLRMLDTGFGAGLLRVRGQYLPGAHEAVITAEEWQAYLDRRADRRRQPSRAKGSRHALSGLVYCARCHGPMYPGLFGQRREPKYRCETAGKRGKAACAGGYVMLGVLERAVRGWLADYATDVDERTAAMEARRSRVLLAQADRTRLERELINLDKALTRHAVDRALHPDALPESVYTATIAELASRRRALDEQLELAGAEERRHARPPEPAVFGGLLAEWDTIDPDGKRDVLQTLIRRVAVLTGRPRGTVEIFSTWEDDPWLG